MEVGREPSAIAAGFVDTLVDALYLDFAFVRLCDPNRGAVVEIARGGAWQAFPEWLQQYLAEGSRLSRREIVRDTGDGARRGCGIVIPVGVDAEGGLVAAACDRADFPSKIDQLLLSVAANHAATAFRMARLLHDHRFAEEALRERESDCFARRATSPRPRWRNGPLILFDAPHRGNRRQLRRAHCTASPGLLILRQER
jgi:hypothetical protein